MEGGGFTLRSEFDFNHGTCMYNIFIVDVSHTSCGDLVDFRMKSVSCSDNIVEMQSA